MSFSHEWADTGINSLVSSKRAIKLDDYPWLIDQLTNNKLVQIDDVHNMVFEANAEQGEFVKQDIKSVLAVPVFADGKLQAFIGIDSIESTREWTQETIERFHIIACILSKEII